MKTVGFISNASFDLDGEMIVAFKVYDKQSMISFINETDKEKKLSIEVKPFRKQRSLDANALLWACLGQMAEALRTDKWDVYLMMLKRYGQFTYMTVKTKALPKLKQVWREIEILSEGEIYSDVICYFGSSTYDTKEFSVLLDGVISEMKDMGLHIPLPEEIERSLAVWEKRTSSK